LGNFVRQVSKVNQYYKPADARCTIVGTLQLYVGILFLRRGFLSLSVSHKGIWGLPTDLLVLVWFVRRSALCGDGNKMDLSWK
jgi:hypothetical protein